MFIVYGKRVMRTNKFTDNRNFCSSCGSPNILVHIYRQYFHFFWIPFFPTGNRYAKMACTGCGEPFRNEAILNEYAFDAKRPPVYLFAGPLLIGLLIVMAVISNANTQKEKAAFVANPKVGDVYTIRKNENNGTNYSFLKVTEIKGDTVFLCSNTLYYSRYVSSLNEADYFDKTLQFGLTKPTLQQMLDNDEINAVNRNYDDYTGFNRMK